MIPPGLFFLASSAVCFFVEAWRVRRDGRHDHSALVELGLGLWAMAGLF